MAWPALSHYLNQWWDIVNWTLRNKLQWNFNRNSNIFIQENVFECVVCEMAAILSRPQCVNQEPLPEAKMTQWTKTYCIYHSHITSASWHLKSAGISTFCSTACSAYHKRKPQTSALVALYEGNPPVNGGIPSQRASNVDNASMSWRHHDH